MAKKRATRKKAASKSVATITHGDDKRTNIPTAELEAIVSNEDKTPVRVEYERRNRDLDPQLVWRGKDEQDWSDLVVGAPPLYIQEKVHPKVLVDDLLKQTQSALSDGTKQQLDLFADFNGLPDDARSAEFYQHEANWTNRMILGDSLQVMASLAEREGLRGRVQCIYIDPPYGIKFNSNFQWSTTSRDVKDGKADHITREPEQVKAFRDTWRDGIHSYLTYLRDRLTVARDLLTESGSIFVQIGDENVHRIRGLMDEVFGQDNFHAQVAVRKASPLGGAGLVGVNDYLLWYNKDKSNAKFRRTYRKLDAQGDRYYNIVETTDFRRRSISKEEFANLRLLPEGARLITSSALVSSGLTPSCVFDVSFQDNSYKPSSGRSWRTNPNGMQRLRLAERLISTGNTLRYVAYFDDFPYATIDNSWGDTGGGAIVGQKIYIVQTPNKILERCVLMTTDPGDLVLDPTCGSGTTAYVAEQWGRRWITVDTSRVALALARARIMGARYPYYLLADSPQGQRKEADVTRSAPSEVPTHGRVRQGFVYERAAHVTLGGIANNAEIDVIWDKFQETLQPLREQLNNEMRRVDGEEGNEPWEEWEIPREAGERWPSKAVVAHQRITGRRRELAAVIKVLESVELSQHVQTVTEQATADSAQDLRVINELVDESYTFESLPAEPREPWPEEAKRLHSDWWEQRIARQQEIDASIAAKADFEYLYDKPYNDKSKVRVAGPFTVESLSPHRVLAVDEDDELVEGTTTSESGGGDEADFAQTILENLQTSGVQQAHKEDKITFTSLTGWPGNYICAEGRYLEDESEVERKAAILVGPEFGTVARADLAAAAREAGEAGFDVLVACAFNFDAHSTDFNKLGPIPILKARMNADLHMADNLKNTGKGNLFVIFGEPDIDILPAEQLGQVQVKINGVDVFKPQSGDVVSDNADGIACWFLDTDYNEESFFVRHAYFLGANDPYKSLKTTLKAEINQEAWASLHSDTSRPFDKPKSGRIAVKVINHLGDEVMKVFRIE